MNATNSRQIFVLKLGYTGRFETCLDLLPGKLIAQGCPAGMPEADRKE